ncbi:MAG: hypothetical protein AB7M05_20155 [Alphaproteobacteria bacterium]
MVRPDRLFGVTRTGIGDFAAACLVAGMLIGVVAVLPPHLPGDTVCESGGPVHRPAQGSGGGPSDYRFADDTATSNGTDCVLADSIEAASPHDELIDAGVLEAAAEDMSGGELC